MRGLTASELLAVWEQAHSLPLLHRAHALLCAASAGAAAERLVELSIGHRDALLLKLREQTFGPGLLGTTVCPACDDRVELKFAINDILVDPMEGDELPATETLSVQVSGCEIIFRAPTARDLDAVSSIDDEDRARNALLDRCLIEAPTSNHLLPESVVSAIVQVMERADPQANTLLALRCPACGHRWQAAFDIASFFWSEINAWAHRVLRQVHVLASAYGWSERDILAMTATRRQLYLEMVGR